MPADPPQPVLNYASPGVAGGNSDRWRGVFGWILLIFVVVALFLVMKSQGSQYATIPFSQFMSELQAGHMAEVTIEKDGVKGKLNTSLTTMPGGAPITFFRVYGPADAASNWQFIEYVNRYRGGARIVFDLNNNALIDIAVPLIPWLIIFGFIWFFLRLGRKAQPAKAKPISVDPAPVQQATGSL